MALHPLGRIVPPDWKHVETHPFSALAPELRPTHVPVAPGVPWYTSFDDPIKLADGTYRLPDVSKGERLGTIRGYHCFALEPAPDPSRPNRELDTAAFHRFYNQLREGACEGFGHARIFSLTYGRLFDAFWLYDDARRIEGTFPNGEGATNRGILQAASKWGVHYASGTEARRRTWETGVAGAHPVVAYRWITTAHEALAALGLTTDHANILNSWGLAYPQRVKLPAATLDRLLSEEGECDVITER